MRHGAAVLNKPWCLFGGDVSELCCTSVLDCST